ncbi:oocyte zinc finger protein XlCOF6-like isoform X6 [Leguminivora glycinivorella]|uniref:oocyte zinc finger protein XlCOF6-like isoform X6 n=1 Tax=Leguminivora glycinivorella TaxID=1035111 RepID=UPI00200FF3A4|nr:oocyte zinc finger protein XlCOF6-like isoform X6 [Leguminivora glycinivorella]
MDFDEIVVKESPGLCRCCLSEGCYKDLGSEYSWMSETEIYADMLLECFDISISQHPTGPNGSNRLICEVCITRLRDACNFKKQVLESEKKFVDMVGRGEFRPKVLLYQTQMKTEHVMDLEEETGGDDGGEVEYLEEDADFVEEELLKNEDYAEASVSEDITVSTLAVKGKRGRPKKSAAKPEKKAKVAKTEEKPKKAVAKDTDQEARKREELNKLLTVLIQNSTVIPFKWHANGFLCFYCGCPFADSSTLKHHTNTEHEDAKLKTVLSTTVSKSKSIKLDISELSCKKCNEAMSDLQEFFTHIQEHGFTINEEASQCCYPFILNDDDMSCLACGMSFRFFGPLLIHTHKYHTKTQPFICEICGQGFIAKANVESHRKSHYKTSSSFKCKECDETFETQHKLIYHSQKNHTSANKFKCPKCPEVLGSKYLKKRHLAFVHDVKSAQFQCDECQKIFSLKNKLLQHKLRVHLKERNVACEICGHKVFSKDLLKRHMVKHDDARPFVCEFCNKTFQRKKTLEFHRRIHTNDKRYQCKECGRSFVQWTSLKLHTRVHHSIVL